MSDWKYITVQAEYAKKKMINNLEEGELEFKKLLDYHGSDGMVYYMRAEAYETLGEFKNANSDFRIARSLFPLDEWKESAQQGMNRVEKEIDKKMK